MMHRSEMLQTISDLSKDAYGYRVRYDYEAMSDEELSATWDRFYDDMLVRDAAEKAAEESAWNEFVEYTDRLMKDHGIDRATALRWDVEAMNAFNGDRVDIGYYCYLRGISYTKEKYLRTLYNS